MKVKVSYGKLIGIINLHFIGIASAVETGAIEKYQCEYLA